MRDLILEHKTGFRSSLPFTIYEPNGNVFYASDFTDKIEKGIPLEFNLPLGSYKYDGSFIKLSFPVATKLITLPQKERNYAKKRYNIIFGSNPNKCTIFYARGVILFDSSYKDKPLYKKFGIYFHELGHHFYKTESKADLYMTKRMLEFGFNPSQIGRTVIDELSDHSIDRILKIVNLLTNNKG